MLSSRHGLCCSWRCRAGSCTFHSPPGYLDSECSPRGSRLVALAERFPICTNSVTEHTFWLSEPQQCLPRIVAEKGLAHHGQYPFQTMVSATYWLDTRYIWDSQHLTDINQLDLLAQLGVREEVRYLTSGDTDDRPGCSVERRCHARPKHFILSFADDATSVQNSDAPGDILFDFSHFNTSWPRHRAMTFLFVITFQSRLEPKPWNYRESVSKESSVCCCHVDQKTATVNGPRGKHQLHVV